MWLSVPPSGLRRLLVLWGPVLAWAFIIFWLSGISDIPTPPSGVTDKQVHMAAYAVGGVLTVRALAAGQWPGVTWGTAWLAAALVTAYGVSDEIHQAFVPGRTPSALDVVADALGAVGGALLMRACAIILAARRRTGREA